MRFQYEELLEIKRLAEEELKLIKSLPAKLKYQKIKDTELRLQDIIIRIEGDLHLGKISGRHKSHE